MRLPRFGSFLVAAVSALAATCAHAQVPARPAPAPSFAPYPSPIPLAEAAGWSLQRLSADQARLSAVGAPGIRLGGLAPDAALDLCADAAGEAAAVLIRHRRYTEILAWHRTPAGIGEVRLPVVPAAQILREYPTAGKPRELVSPRLDGMRVEQAGWGAGRRLAARVRLELVDDSNASTAWSYVVDVVWSLPPGDAPAGTAAILSVVNVVLLRSAERTGK